MRTTKQPVHMRLVRDDETMLDIEEALVPADTEDPIPNQEQPDGAIEEAQDEADDSSESSSDLPPVNLAAMEALLFSTHHPLTAGRLAELLELESTKPIRRAIKELNEQYVATDARFRVEQVSRAT